MKKPWVLTTILSTFTTILVAQDTVQEAQAMAVKQHPDLAIVGSPFHTRFINAYKDKKSLSPEFFNSVDWPVKLAHEVTYKIESGLLGGKKISTKYKGTEMLMGDVTGYERNVSVEMVLSNAGGIDFYYLTDNSKPHTLHLAFTEDDAEQFKAFLEKSLEYHAIAEKENVKSYRKLLGEIGKYSYSFARTATGMSIVSVASQQFGPDQVHYIGLEGMAATLELMQSKSSLQQEKNNKAKEAEENRRKNDLLFK